MGPDEVYKNKIGARITKTLGEALLRGDINEDEASEIGDYVMENIDNAKNNAELLDFLINLANKWPVFDSILTAELQQATGAKEDAVVKETEDLIKENKIDEALKTVKNVGGGENGGVS